MLTVFILFPKYILYLINPTNEELKFVFPSTPQFTENQ